MTRLDVHIERLVLDGLALDAQGIETLRLSLEATLGAIGTSRDPAPDAGRGDGAASRTDPASPAGLGREAAVAISRTVGQ